MNHEGNPSFQDEFAHLDATAQSDLVRRGEVQPVELVEAAIARIERLNLSLHAVTTSLFNKALAQAVSPHLPDGPFRGVPLLLKDFFCEKRIVGPKVKTRFHKYKLVFRPKQWQGLIRQERSGGQGSAGSWADLRSP